MVACTMSEETSQDHSTSEGDRSIFRWVDAPQEIRDLILENVFRGEILRCVDRTHLKPRRRFVPTEDPWKDYKTRVPTSNEPQIWHQEATTSVLQLQPWERWNPDPENTNELLAAPAPPEAVAVASRPMLESSLPKCEPATSANRSSESVLPQRLPAELPSGFVKRPCTTPYLKDLYPDSESAPCTTPSPEDEVLDTVPQTQSSSLHPYIACEVPELPEEPYNLVLALSTVGKTFLKEEEIQKALLRNAVIRLETHKEVERLIKRVKGLQAKNVPLHITFHDSFLPQAALKYGRFFTFTESLPGSEQMKDLLHVYVRYLTSELGSFRVNLIHDRPLLLSVVSGGVSCGNLFQNDDKTASATTDLTWHYQNSTISEIEASTLVLSACNETNVNYLGYTLAAATKFDIQFDTTFRILFLKRPDKKVVLEVDKARFDTTSWCLEFEVEGKSFSISQALSKECFERGFTDVRELLGKLRRENVMVNVVDKDGCEQAHWTYWYDLPKL